MMRVLSMTTAQLNLLPPADRAKYIQLVSLFLLPFPLYFVFIVSVSDLPFYLESIANYVRCPYNVDFLTDLCILVY